MKKEIPAKEEIVQQIKKMMEKEPWCAAWFEPYNQSSWAQFIESFAEFKQSALTFPTLYINDFKPKVTEFNDYAYKILMHIQNKKLFNLQCEWRAERIKLPGIEISYDFIILEPHVLTCPYIPPVTKEEMEVYIEFLESSYCELYDSGDVEWQDYPSMVRKHITGFMRHAIPSWFRYYDKVFDTEFLMELPDIRGEKELHYSNAFYTDPARLATLPPPPPPTPEMEAIKKDFELNKPHLSSYDKRNFIEFAKHFEDDETMEILLSHAKAEMYEEDFEYLDELYEYMKSIPGEYPFVEADDWKESLEMTVWNYKKENYIKALPRAWRQYRRKTGDHIEANAEELIRNFATNFKAYQSDAVRNHVANAILSGRKVLGEPENFDF